MNWQPIETAPKDGTKILLMEGDSIYKGAYKESYWVSYCGQPVVYTPDPDKWCPIDTSESASTPVDVQETEGVEVDPIKEGITRMINGCGVRQEIKDILIYLHKSDKSPMRYAEVGSAIEAIIEQQSDATNSLEQRLERLAENWKRQSKSWFKVYEDNVGVDDGMKERCLTRANVYSELADEITVALTALESKLNDKQ